LTAPYTVVFKRRIFRLQGFVEHCTQLPEHKDDTELTSLGSVRITLPNIVRVLQRETTGVGSRSRLVVVVSCRKARRVCKPRSCISRLVFGQLLTVVWVCAWKIRVATSQLLEEAMDAEMSPNVAISRRLSQSADCLVSQ